MITKRKDVNFLGFEETIFSVCEGKFPPLK
jgi:hypothetical protein